MVRKIKGGKKIRCRSILFIIIFILIQSLVVSASGWYRGELHVYTGFRGEKGYGDGFNWCGMGNEAGGYNINDLKIRAKDRGIKWQGYADENFCLDSSEFDTVKTDCQNAEDSDFTCLHGETLIVKDDSEFLWSEQYCVYCKFDNFLCTMVNGYPIEPLLSSRAGRIGAYGISNYINPDMGSEGPLTTWCYTSLDPQDGIDEVSTNGGISVIHSPFGEVTAIADIWDFESIDTVSDYDGIEIWHTNWQPNDQKAVDWWINSLLNDKKIFVFGGIGTHFPGNVFGSVYNIAYLTSLTQSDLKTALKSGYSFVSNNGELYIEIQNPYDDSWEHMGETFEICQGDTINIKATYDVSVPCTLRIYGGAREEYSWEYSISESGYESISPGIYVDYYFRAECITPDGTRRIYTNPIWVEIDETDVDGDGYCSASDCNDNDKDEHPDNAEINCVDTKDNDCDGLIDGDDPDCPPVGCVCSSWKDVACGSNPCSSSKMKQTRSCNPNGCDTEVRCVSDPSCGEPDECDEDENWEYCYIDPEMMAQLDVDAPRGWDLDDRDRAYICGDDAHCTGDLVFGMRFDLDDCKEDLEGKEDWILQVEMEWDNDGGNTDDCSDTDLYVYTDGDRDISNPDSKISELSNKGNWNKVDDFPSNCDVGWNEMYITEEFKNDLDISDNYEIVYGFWPEGTQNLWKIEDAGKDVDLDVEYCKPCTDNDGDGYGTDCPQGDDCDDTDPSVHPGVAEICGDGKDNDCLNGADCADSVCSGEKCGLCKTCSGGSCSGTPSDDSDCGRVDCSGWYVQTGDESATGTETCYNKQDFTSGRCEGFGDCRDDNTADCASQSNDQPVYSCGLCTYISASSCTGADLGSCSLYGTAIECNSDYKCSDSAGGNNAYNHLDYKNPSKSFCDGKGQCDYGSSSPTCDYAEGSEGVSLTSVCVDGESACQDSCNDGYDNDNDELIDGNDPDCILDTDKFYHKDSSENIVAWLGNEGNIVLKGDLHTETDCDSPVGESFLFKDSGDIIAYIDSNGDMCIEGLKTEEAVNCDSPTGDSFIVKDSGTNKIYVEQDGDLCLIGKLYDNIDL